MIELPERHWDPQTKIFGIDTWHSPLAIWAFDHVLNNLKPARIVEIGTGYGGLTAYLGLWAAVNGAHIVSFDTVGTVAETALQALVHLPVMLVHMDVLKPEGEDTIKALTSGEDAVPVLLYCDGGNKAEELLRFARGIPVGSVIGCHDYGTEVPPCVADFNMRDWGFSKYVDGVRLAELGTRQAFWIRDKEESK